jgi:vacuolar-type H+-ATPase subunit H
MAKAAQKTEQLFLKNTHDGTVRPVSRGIWNMVKTKVHPHKKTPLYQLVDADEKVIEEHDLLASAEAVKKNAPDVDVPAANKIIDDAEKLANTIISDARTKAGVIIKEAEAKAKNLVEKGQAEAKSKITDAEAKAKSISEDAEKLANKEADVKVEPIAPAVTANELAEQAAKIAGQVDPPKSIKDKVIAKAQQEKN